MVTHPNLPHIVPAVETSTMMGDPVKIINCSILAWMVCMLIIDLLTWMRSVLPHVQLFRERYTWSQLLFTHGGMVKALYVND